MHSVVSVLAEYPVLTLFVVIGLGYLLGELNLFGFRFGVTGVLFAGLLIGGLSPAIALPEMVSSLGLIIFVYTIGIQSGPAFFESFRKDGLRNTLLACGVLCAGALLTLGLGFALQLSRPLRAGLYCGALTNTPALAATREAIREAARSRSLSPEEARAAADEPVVAYSLTYPMGVIALLLAFQVTRRRWAAEPQSGQEPPEIRAQDFVVKNPGVIGRTLGEILYFHKDPGFVISRVQKNGQTTLARSDTLLEEGDILVAVGDDTSLERARLIFGQPSEKHIELDRSELDFRRVFVSNERVVGKRLRDLDLEGLSATVTRLRRSDMDLVPTPDARLEYGDRVRVLTRRENFPAISKLFGDSIRGTAEADFGSVALGMVLGVLAGMIPLPLPGGTVVRLGLAGGPLLVALVLGKLERTGRITWIMPISANLTLRQIGLLLFLGAVGTKAGGAFVQTLGREGLLMVLGGTVLTFAVALLALLVGRRLLHAPFDLLMGLVAGVHTQPAALAFAANLTKSDRPNVAYAAIYPVAMITKIILAQLLVA